MQILTFAAIDVGAYNVSMEIFEITRKTGLKSLNHVDYRMELGRDTYARGKISNEMVTELCGVLNDFKRIMEEYQVDDYRACATSALREAQNVEIVLGKIYQNTGLKVHVLSNSEQRFVGYKSIASSVAAFPQIIEKGTAVIDVGGGSSQISLFDKDALVTTQNLPLGVMRLRAFLNRLQNGSRVSRMELLDEMVDNELFTFRKMYLKDREIKNLIATGSTVIHLARHFTESGPGEWISAGDYREFYRRVTAMSRSQKEDVLRGQPGVRGSSHPQRGHLPQSAGADRGGDHVGAGSLPPGRYGGGVRRGDQAGGNSNTISPATSSRRPESSPSGINVMSPMCRRWRSLPWAS